MGRPALTSKQHDDLREVMQRVNEHLEQSEGRGDSAPTILSFLRQKMREMANICDREIQCN